MGMRRVRRLWIALAVVAVVAWLLLPSRGPKVERGSILVLDLEGEFVEAVEPSLWSRLLGVERRPFASLLSELAKAQRDDRLAAVVLRVRGLELGWGMAAELRDAIAELAAKRRTVAYLEVGALAANREYFVATGAPEIVLAPGTTSPLLGLAAEFLFLGGLWEKLGAGVEAIGSGEYKSGAETLAGRKMSPAHREMAAALLDSTYAWFVEGIASARGLTPEFVRDAIDHAPVSPEELRGLGLVDRVAFLDQTLEDLGGGPVVEDEDYRGVDPGSVGFDPVARFALVYGSGTVVTGEGESPTGALRLASDDVSEALEQAASDPEIAAIVFRVDSPGGSPLAADLVWRAAARAKEKGKPLVASVSDVAASGGYYVLCGADEIVASPASLVGSIGVFVVRPVFAGLLEKLGIGYESMTRGEHADLLVSTRPLSQPGRERLGAELEAIYQLFLERVADGRGLAREAVHAVARGRVWTGAQAAEVGLVDGLGGLRAAVRRAKERAGIDPDADVALVPYPKPRSLFEQVDEALRQAAVAARPGLPGILRALEPLVGAWSEDEPLALPPFLVRIR
jgi:protease-4